MIRPAEHGDLAAVTELLRAVGLPVAGLSDQFPQAYVVSVVAGRIAGSAGLEQHGQYGLLRSVAVEPSCRGRLIGAELVGDRLSAARGTGLHAVYALTTTAADYFQQHGFVRVQRTEAPAAVRASLEFASVCPAEAACLAWVNDSLRPF